MQITAVSVVSEDSGRQKEKRLEQIYVLEGYNDMNKIGFWGNDADGLPCFEYVGDLPYKEKLPSGKDVKLPEDPWFQMGNYRLTLFARVSGELDLITGERSWGRLNQSKTEHRGESRIFLRENAGRDSEITYSMAGTSSLAADHTRCRRIFGVGFALYIYHIGNLILTRRLSVMPSATPYDGTSAVLVTVSVENKGNNTAYLVYSEEIPANYTEIQYQGIPEEKRKVQYSREFSMDEESGTGTVRFLCQPADPLLAASPDSVSLVECFPPALFIRNLKSPVEKTGCSGVAGEDDCNQTIEWNGSELSTSTRFRVSAGEKQTFEFILGYSFDDTDAVCAQMLEGRREEPLAGSVRKCNSENVQTKSDESIADAFSYYGPLWKDKLPVLEDEQDLTLRREMRWHAYCLEAMAQYSSFFHETKVPQGTIYDYEWGMHASARDNFQHGLPLVMTDPALAKSILRYMMKRTTGTGDIKLDESGVGYAENERFMTSDQQLSFFLLMGEYLEDTQDYAFLREKIRPYPAATSEEITVLDIIQNCFLYLRDRIGTGEHGLVRLLNSDWNDGVYYTIAVPYNCVVFTGESHMNSAMAIAVLQKMIPQLEMAGDAFGSAGDEREAKKACALSGSMKLYRTAQLNAFRKDLGDRAFPRRMYFDGKAYGEDRMYLEPMGYALQIVEMPEDWDRNLLAEMKKRLYQNEKLGARQQEKPADTCNDEFDPGSRENGGFWWSLNGPVIAGVARFDCDEAKQLLRSMTLDNMSKQFPDYWSSYWSAADNQESSLVEGEGLPDQSARYADIPISCAHPHAWLLYCYLKIREAEKRAKREA